MTGPRGHGEDRLAPQAAAMLQALRSVEDMPPAAHARVWARLAAATAEPESWPKGKVAGRRSEWLWAAVVVAAAAGVLLASRAGVLGPRVGARGGEAASYSEGPGTGPGVAAPGPERAGAAASVGPVGHVEKDMVLEADASVGAALIGPPSPAPAGESRAASRAPRGEEAKARPRSEPEPQVRASEAAASTLAQEAAALARAQAAIQGGRAEEALAVLAGYAQQFPGGALREEHDALRALALCAAGRSIEGRGAARAFLSARGGSALAERVRRGCLAGAGEN